MNLPQSVIDQEAKANEIIKAQEKPKEEDLNINVAPEILGNEQDLNLPEEFKQDEHAKIIKKAPPVDESTKALETERRLNKSLDNENRSLKIKIVKLEKDVTDLNAKIQATHVKQEESKFTDGERKVFEDEGLTPEIINILEKRNAPPTQTVNPEVETLREELSTVREVTAQTSAEVFQSALDRMCPGWREKNENDTFVQGLQELAPYSNKTKQQILQEAYNSQDVTLVSQIFNDFKPKGETPPRAKLEDLAQPKSANGSPPPTGQPDRWTPAKIEKFYVELVKDPQKYTPEQIAAIEKAYINPR